MGETLPARRGVDTAVYRRTAVRVPVPPRYQAELPEIAAAGRGVSRTTGTQNAG